MVCPIPDELENRGALQILGVLLNGISSQMAPVTITLTTSKALSRYRTMNQIPQ